MENISKDIEILIGKSISGNANREELTCLEAWTTESAEHIKEYDLRKKAWESVGDFLSEEKKQKDKQTVWSEIYRRERVRFKKAKQWSAIYKVAAILAFPLALLFSKYLISTTDQNPVPETLCTVSAPKGHIAKCVLPDGTGVWINTNSSITYDIASYNGACRDISLLGEAYFEVSQNKGKPFVVKTPLANVIVTGTSFNVKAYPESGSVEAVLAEGSIDMELNNPSLSQKIGLSPGERAIYRKDQANILVDKVDCNVHTAWRNGEIIFKDATMQDLLNELERIYDIRFKMEDKSIGGYRFRGMFSYNNNLIDALEKIKRTSNIDYYIQDKVVWLKRKDNSK